MKNILLVDDDRDLSQSLANLFDSDKFHFDFLEDGMEVGNYVKENSSVDLVMLDVNLPSLSGLDVLKQIKHCFSIIACSYKIAVYFRTFCDVTKKVMKRSFIFEEIMHGKLT